MNHIHQTTASTITAGLAEPTIDSYWLSGWSEKATSTLMKAMDDPFRLEATHVHIGMLIHDPCMCACMRACRHHGVCNLARHDMTRNDAARHDAMQCDAT